MELSYANKEKIIMRKTSGGGGNAYKGNKKFKQEIGVFYSPWSNKWLVKVQNAGADMKFNPIKTLGQWADKEVAQKAFDDYNKEHGHNH